LELIECRQRLLRETRRPDGSEWGSRIADPEFQAVVRNLVSRTAPTDTAADVVLSLARRYQEIRTTLAMANSRLVAHVAKRFVNRGIPAGDLIQEGFCGLLTAIDRFDPANTTRLATYAVWWIRQAMQRAVAAGAYPVRLNPKQLLRLARAIPQSGAISSGPHSDPRPAERDRACGWSDLAAIRPRLSLDAICRTDAATPLANLLAIAPEHDQQENESVEWLFALIRNLKPREQTVLKLRFGLDGETRHSLSQVSKVLEVSKERIRQIQERALEKLRTAADLADDGEPIHTTPAVARSGHRNQTTGSNRVQTVGFLVELHRQSR
jgi:RNA polymerase primary sigma factor